MAGFGAYELHQPIGRGGVGEVWRARHTTWRTHVAIKVLPGGLEGADAAALQSEVRAVAGLNHPGIVRVLDQGLVPMEAERSTRGRLRAGQPYLTMELLEGGTLSQERGRVSWPRLRWLLLRILDSLAHAHAHGLVHRDLKPGNLLRNESGSRVVLIDFGLAALLNQANPDGDAVRGTPAYMAPEQLLGAWREQGPWTDLYALGCTAWTLATGERPFGHGEHAAAAHIRTPPPAFAPTRPMPPAFEDWLRRLLRKPPGERFQRAAEAAWSLSRIQAQGSVSPIPSAPIPELPVDALQPLQGTATLVLSALQDAAALSGAQHVHAQALPLPLDWRIQTPRWHTLSVTGGRGLVGVRSLRMVGREAERDRLWGLLRQVMDTRSAGVALVRGPVGIGKTRLARWLAVRSHELGATTVLWSSGAPSESPGGGGAGLGGALSRSVHGVGLDRRALRERLDRELGHALSAEDLDGLLELASPTGGASRELVRRRSARIALVGRWLRALAAQRPVVLVFDELDASPDAQALARRLLEGDLGVPVLLVATTADPATSEDPELESVLGGLVELGAHDLRVPPLSGDEHLALVSTLLGLSPALAGAVCQRTAGNPLFAIQLVRELVDQDQLVVGEAGLELAPGHRLELPAGLRAVWSSRIERALEHWQAPEQHALELAATLGHRVIWSVFARACRAADLPLPGDRIQALASTRLLSADGRLAFAFPHAMLRQALVERARTGDRLQRWHAACAHAVAPLDGDQWVEAAARHLVGAGEHAASLQPLMDASRARANQEAHSTASALLRLRREALQALAVPADHVAWGAQETAEMEQVFASGNLLGAEALAEATLQRAWTHGWRQTAAECTEQLGLCLRNRGHAREAVRHLEAAERAWSGLGDPRRLARLRTHLGDVSTDLGRLPAAEGYYADALATLDALGDTMGAARARVGLASCRRQQGRLEDTRLLLTQALDDWRSMGNRWGEGIVHNDLADVLRLQGQLEPAREGFLRAKQIGEALGYRPLVPEINLCLVLAEQGRHHQAIEQLEALLVFLQAWGRLNWAVHVRTALLRSLASVGDRARLGQILDDTERFLAEEGLVDEEMARFLDTAGATARVQGWAPESARLSALARAQWTRLNG